MTKEELVSLIDSWDNLKILENEIASSSDLYKMLMEIALSDNEPKSWRAAYLIDKINDNHSELLYPFLNEMIDQVRIEKSESKKRHFLKLISMNEIDQVKQGLMLEFCIETFTSAKSPVAVRVHAMQILFNISEVESALKPEILIIIENEMENHSSAGILSRGRKLVQKLRKQIG